MTQLFTRCLCCLIATLLIAFAGCSGGGSNDADDVPDTPAPAPPQTAPAEQADLPPGWGSLQGRITLSGAPQPEKIVITGNVAYCGQFNLMDESIKANAMGGGLANVMIWLYVTGDDERPDPHPSYADAAKAEIVFDNHQCRFTPRAVVLRTGQTLAIKNSDTVAHNTLIEYEPDPINPNLPPGDVIKKPFPEPTRFPLVVRCSSHPWMTARIMVVDTPYFAVTDENGEFEIPLLPPGEWTFQFYHEEFGYVSQVEYQGQRARWEKGRPQFTIAGGKLTDLGEVKLKYADYAETP